MFEFVDGFCFASHGFKFHLLEMTMLQCSQAHR